MKAIRTTVGALIEFAVVATAAVAQQPLPAWTLRGPTLEIGRSGVELHRVRAAALLSDGRIAIADGGNTRVLIVSPTGAVLREFGRVGSGPSDFQMIWSLTAIGDTLVIWDTGLHRMALWRPDGSLIRTVPLDAAAGRVVDVQAVLTATDYLVTTRGGAIPPRNGLHHDTLPLLRLNGLAINSRPLGAREWSLSYAYNDGRGSTMYGTPFLGATLAAASRGRTLLLPIGSATVEVTRADGSAGARITLPVTREPYDRTRVTAYRDSLLRLADAQDPGTQARISAVFGNEFPVPEYAAVAQRATTVGGTVWFQAYPGGRDTTTTWYVVDAEREQVVARLVLNKNWRVLGGDDRTVIVLQRDELGVERVSVYAIARG